ncbi:MAG: hypothetical protein KAS66_05350 [Candidatus Omnitrophica bacterium]|nr:hypothetical protein [Candidatus Omnitrophota bacterium]
MSEHNMSKEDMDEIKAFIRDVGEELAGTVATTKMEAIARAHVQEEFRMLGVDASTADGVKEFQANMATLDRLRRVSEKIGLTIILTFFTVLTGGIISLIWQSIGGGKGTG